MAKICNFGVWPRDRRGAMTIDYAVLRALVVVSSMVGINHLATRLNSTAETLNSTLVASSAPGSGGASAAGSSGSSGTGGGTSSSGTSTGTTAGGSNSTGAG